MSFTRSLGGPSSTPARADARVAMGYEEQRRATRSTRLGTGTLACVRCDAPIAIGAAALAPGDPLRCPYCEHRAPLRDFLSLAAPARPARVVVSVRHGGR